MDGLVVTHRDVNKMTRKEFEALPHRQSWDEEFIADCLIILPTRRLHDSAYRCMDFVGCAGENYVRLSGGSDVIHIDGIGGLGENWLEKFGTVPTATRPIGWSVDCLATSGLLRLFAPGYKIKCGPAHSSFEIFATPTESELERREKYEGSLRR